MNTFFVHKHAQLFRYMSNTSFSEHRRKYAVNDNFAAPEFGMEN